MGSVNSVAIIIHGSLIDWIFESFGFREVPRSSPRLAGLSIMRDDGNISPSASSSRFPTQLSMYQECKVFLLLNKYSEPTELKSNIRKLHSGLCLHDELVGYLKASGQTQNLTGAWYRMNGEAVEDRFVTFHSPILRFHQPRKASIMRSDYPIICYFVTPEVPKNRSNFRRIDFKQKCKFEKSLLLSSIIGLNHDVRPHAITCI